MSAKQSDAIPKPEDSMAYRFGIDAGSKTIKVVILDEDGNLLHHAYVRHRTDIRTRLAEILHSLIWRFGDMEGTLGITGSAGIGLAETLEMPFFQEVVATTHAVTSLHPNADAFVELGGEDAKVVYLTGGIEQRMNATCAGGTGGFIDGIAFMIGVKSSEMSRLSLSSNRIYPIASRCAVFAQNDIRPLLNAGAKKADIAASALEAVVRQTLGGLACGRPIEGTVIFLGGPLEHIPELTRRFRNALGLTRKTGIKPENAHLYTAQGAALMAAAENAPTITLSQLDLLLETADPPANDLPRLDPLFESAADLAAFAQRHNSEKMPRKRLMETRGALYLGIDAGSTAVKIAVIDDEGNLVHSDYHHNEGDVLKTTIDLLIQLYVSIPKDVSRQPLAHIAHATVTGYGEELLKAALGVDSGVVETLAHVRGAKAFDPALTFLLDIGGQDMKAIWLKDGRIVNAVLNEACSSGCGSFIEGTAYSLNSTPYRMAEMALHASSPVDLGTKCTVFMSSRVRHAQKIGVETSDIAAGLAYSVVRNALFRIIGTDKLDSLGDHIVVQGGAFKNDAVLRAFELISGKNVARPDTAHLMGAIGAALTAQMRAQHAETPTRSGIASTEELRAINPKQTAAQCPGCGNSCAISIVDFGTGRTFISGNRCERAASYFKEEAPERNGKNGSTVRKPPNVIELEQKVLARYGRVESLEPRGHLRIGILNVLPIFGQVPFWHTLFTELGFSVLMPDDQRAHIGLAARKGAASIPSESACQPAKLAHPRLYDLLDEGADAIFLPHYERGMGCPVSRGYANALADSVPEIRNGERALVSPRFSSVKLDALVPEGDEGRENREALLCSLNAFLEGASASFVENAHASLIENADVSSAEDVDASFAKGLDTPLIRRDELDSAIAKARAAQNAFLELVERANTRALSWVRESAERRGVVLAGRPYHIDPALLHGVDHVLTELGFAVLSPTALPNDGAALPLEPQAIWTPAKHLLRIAGFVAQHPDIELVNLRAFGCGFDAVSVPLVQDALEKRGKSLTSLKIDDMADTTHIRIRLRTLAETLREENAGEGSGNDVPRDAFGAVSTSPIDALTKPLEQADIDEARRSANGDLCFVTSILAGRVIRLMKEDPSVNSFTLPAVCEKCLVGAIPEIARRATGRIPHIEWTKHWPDTPSSPQCQDGIKAAGASQGQDEPRTFNTSQGRGESAIRPSDNATRSTVGIIGCPLLCFDDFANDRIVEFAKVQGHTVFLPNADALFTDDVRYLDELTRFESLGVNHVIYLQSFGCLKGHVGSRGALHQLRTRFPNMPITVLDYDPEASALNRENRIRLALSSTDNR